MLKKTVLFLMASVSLMAMHEAELNINETDMEVNLRFDLAQASEYNDPDTLFFGLRYINASYQNSTFSYDQNRTETITLSDGTTDTNTTTVTYEEDPELIEVSLLKRQDLGRNDISLGIGIKANHTSLGTQNFVSVPIGMEVVKRIVTDKYIPFYLNGAFYYAPEVLSFQDGERYLEYRISADAEIMEDGMITAGYRHIQVKFKEDISRDMNNAFFLGFKVRF